MGGVRPRRVSLVRVVTTKNHLLVPVGGLSQNGNGLSLSKQFPDPAPKRLRKADYLEVGDAPQAALNLSDAGSRDIPPGPLAGRCQVLLRPILRDSQAANLRSDQVFILSAHSAKDGT